MSKKALGIISGLIMVLVATQFALVGEAQSVGTDTASLSISKAASVAQTDGGNVVFALEVKNNAQCGIPFNSMMVFDRSSSMGYDGENPPQPITDAKQAVYTFLDTLDLTKDKTGLVVYNQEPELISGLTTQTSLLKNSLASLLPKGRTNIADSITMAAAQLQGVSNPVIILFTDGYANRPEPEKTAASAAIAAAAAAKSQGIRIVAIGLGSGADLQTLRALASSADDFHFAPSAADLTAIFTSLAKSFQGISPDTKIVDDLTAMLGGFNFVSASDGGAFANNQVSWQLGDLKCGETKQVTFEMQPRLCGTNPGSYPNMATVNNGIGDVASSNQTQVKLLLPNLTLSLTDNASLAKVGQQLDFAITVANTGDGKSGNINVEYLVPDVLEIVASSISDGGSHSLGKITWQLQLAAGESRVLHFAAMVKDSVAEGYSDMVSTVRLTDGCGTKEATDATQLFKEITPNPDYQLFVNCINYADGKLEAFFGYENKITDLQPLDQSDLTPANVDGHAPKVLKSGRFEQDFRVVTTGDNPSITWSTSVAGIVQEITADRNSIACPVEITPPVVPSYPPAKVVIGAPKVQVPASPTPNFPPVALVSATTKLPRCENRVLVIDQCDLSDQDGVITAAQFSLNGGQSWYPVKEISGLGTSHASCRIETPSLADGTYELRVRALDNNANFGNDMVRDFVIDCEGIVIGSPQFNQRGLLAPINDRGRVQSFVNTDLYMAIDVAGGPDKVEVHVERDNTDQVFSLKYNSQLELWEGNLIFPTSGVYDLRVVASEANGQSTSRYTNSVEVISGSRVTDNSAKSIENAQVWVYFRNNREDSWRLWNGGVFGITQPLKSSQLEVVLEPGEYYLQVEHPDYFTTTTKEFSVSEYSILNSPIKMYAKGDIFNWFNSISAQVDVVPITEELIVDLQKMIGQKLPRISIKSEGKTQTTDELLSNNKPFVLVTWTDWGTISAAQWQNISDLFAKKNAELFTGVDIYPIGLLEGEEEDVGVKNRGTYDFPIYKPANLSFFDIMHVISAPQYFFVDTHGIVKDIRVGTMLPSEVARILNNIDTLPNVAEEN